jgi:hypothetical protein
MPSTSDEWKAIAHDFETKFKFWNCIGAFGGKHIAIRNPAHAGSVYYNYMGFFSVVLLAVVNANKEFLMVDVGINGRISDGGVLFHSKFGELFQAEKLNLPPPSPLPNCSENFPFVFVGDEAFALHTNLIKPYAQKNLNEAKTNFNKRLSAARSVVENAFGILASRFRVLGTTINLEPLKVSIITLACCYLHNFLIREKEESYLAFNGEAVDRCNIVELRRTKHRNTSTEAKNVRDEFCRYFCEERMDCDSVL